MASTSVAGIHELPNEVLLSIFSILPVKELIHCAAVCERWHGIVSGFTHLWKDKRYVGKRSPTVTTEMCTVLHALPPFEEVFILPTNMFAVDIFYPRVFLLVADAGALQNARRLRCKYLSTTLDVVRDILFSRSTLDFMEIQKLHIHRRLTDDVWDPSDYTEEYVLRSALELLPNLGDLTVRADSLSAAYLDTLDGISRLHTIEIECPGLEKLKFLRHCSRMLEDLHLVGCVALPSQEYLELQRLGNLRRLLLENCWVEEGDLGVAAAALRSLEALRVAHCGVIQDLSILQHCRQLREIHIVNAYLLDALLTVAPAEGRMRLRFLPTPYNTNEHSLKVVGVKLTLDNLSNALWILEEMGLSSSCLANLGSLHNCPQLRYLYFEFVRGPHKPELLNL